MIMEEVLKQIQKMLQESNIFGFINRKYGDNEATLEKYFQYTTVIAVHCEDETTKKQFRKYKGVWRIFLCITNSI
jgi:hypothetical protein